MRQSLINKKFYQQDMKTLFSNDLSKSDLRGVSAIECNFDGMDLSEANCEGANFYGSSFVDTRLHSTNMKDAILDKVVLNPSEAFGMILSLKCSTFERVKVARDWYVKMLYLISLMECEDEKISNGLIAAIGAENYAELKVRFKRRVI